MPVFGQPLMKLALRTQRAIPLFLEKSFACILNHLCVEGIFRLAGSNDEITRMELLIDASDDYPAEQCSIHTVTNLITRFIRNIPDHLLNDLTVKRWQKENLTVSDIKKLVSDLPILNCALLSRICGLFRVISLKSDQNKMTSKNLAIILSPNIIVDESKQAWLLPIDVSTKFIENYYEIFDSCLAIDSNGNFLSDEVFAQSCQSFTDQVFVRSLAIPGLLGSRSSIQDSCRRIEFSPVPDFETLIGILLNPSSSQGESDVLYSPEDDCIYDGNLY